MLIQENLIIVVERNIEQKDRKVKASEFLVANHNHRITELQFIAFCNNNIQSFQMRSLLHTNALISKNTTRIKNLYFIQNFLCI